MQQFKMFIVVLLLNLCPHSSLNAQSRVFTFTINGTDYNVGEAQMNDLFGTAFNHAITKGVTTNSDFSLWRDSFERLKDNAERGRFAWTTYGSILGQYSYTGDHTEYDLGYQDNGKPAKGNPNKASNKAMRMSILNTYIWILITNSVTETKVSW